MYPLHWGFRLYNDESLRYLSRQETQRDALAVAVLGISIQATTRLPDPLHAASRLSAKGQVDQSYGKKHVSFQLIRQFRASCRRS